MKRNILIFLFLLSFVILGLLIFRGISGEDDWICDNGQWIRHGNPSSPQPTAACPEFKSDDAAISQVVPTSTVATSTAQGVVKVFFGNSKNDPNVINCQTTYSVTRQISASEDKYLAVLRELLAGPTEAEKTSGFFTTINEAVALPEITLVDGILTADFAPDLEKGIGGSCRVAAINSQLVNTLQQFPEVKQVVISIDGRTADILQP